MYRSTIMAVVVLTALPGLSSAASWEYAREAQSGVPKVVWRYVGFNPKDCSERGGVARVVAKPQYGKLSKVRVVAPHLSDRLNPNSPCLGKNVAGLQVTYTSAPGYRGADRFVIERTLWDGRVDVDTFVMTVR